MQFAKVQSTRSGCNLLKDKIGHKRRPLFHFRFLVSCTMYLLRPLPEVEPQVTHLFIYMEELRRGRDHRRVGCLQAIFVPLAETYGSQCMKISRGCAE